MTTVQELEVEMERRYTQLDDDVKEIHKALKTIVGSTERTAACVERMDERLGSVETTVGRMDERLGSVETTVGRMDERLGSVEGRLERVEKSNDRTEQRVKDLCTKVDILGYQHSNQGSDIQRLEDDMVTVRRILEAHGQQLDGQVGLAKGHDARLITHGERLDAQAETLERHGATLQAHGERLGTMDGKLDTIVDALGGGPSGTS